MGQVYDILAVKTVRRTLFARTGRVRHYQVTINGVAGHDVITLPWYNFDGMPKVGCVMECVQDTNPYNEILWKIHRPKLR